jgi:hypothetical protein
MFSRRARGGCFSLNLGGSMTIKVHYFDLLVILNRTTPRRHWKVLLSLEKKRYSGREAR